MMQQVLCIVQLPNEEGDMHIIIQGGVVSISFPMPNSIPIPYASLVPNSHI